MDNLPDTPQSVESPKDRAARLFARPDLIDIVCANVAEGRTVPDIAETLDVNFGLLWNWLHSDRTRKQRYFDATLTGSEFWKQKVQSEFAAIGTFDIRQIFNDDGTIKLPREWPRDAARAIGGMELSEIWDGQGGDRELIGQLKKVKIWDRLKSLELLAKTYGMFTEKVEHKVTLTLEDLLAQTWKEPK